MLTKKVIIVGVAIFVLSSFFSTVSYCEEEFPEWVPKGAVEKAKEILVEDREIAEYLFSMKIEDLQRCELKHPCELIKINYLDYEAGDDIRKAFRRDEYYAFGVYLDNKWVANVGVRFEEGNWEYLNSSIIGKIGRNEDPLGAIYNNSPVSNETKIYRKLIDERRYFVEKDSKIIKGIICSPCSGILYFEPEYHMLEEKERRIKRNKKMLERIKSRTN